MSERRMIPLAELVATKEEKKRGLRNIRSPLHLRKSG